MTIYTFNFTPLTDTDNTITATVEFSGWDAEGKGGQFYLDNVATYGDISAVPEPATFIPALFVVSCGIATKTLRR